MKTTDLSVQSLAKLFLALSVGLSVSVNSYASTKTLALFNVAGEQIGVATLDNLPYAQAEMRATMNDNTYTGLTYTGVGTVNKSLHNYAKAMQSNRGKLPQQEKKHVLIELTAENSPSLSCDLNLYYGKVSGQCANASKEVFVVRQ